MASLHRIQAQDQTYQYVIFQKNQKRLGSLVIDGKYIKPRIGFRPLKEENEAVKIETALGSMSSNDVLGMYCKCCIKAIILLIYL